MVAGQVGVNVPLEILAADDFSVQDMMTVVTNSIFEDLDGEDLPDLDYDDQINDYLANYDVEQNKQAYAIKGVLE